MTSEDANGSAAAEYTIADNEHAKEVYAYYGLAMMHAQHLERVLIGMLIVFDLAPQLASYPHAERPAQWEKIMASLEKDTLGRLIGRICTPETPQHIVERLNGSNERRVFLAHHFFPKCAHDMLTAKGRARLIDELKSIRKYLKGTVEMLDAVAQPALDKLGLTTERVRKAGDDYLRQLRDNPD